MSWVSIHTNYNITRILCLGHSEDYMKMVSSVYGVYLFDACVTSRYSLIKPLILCMCTDDIMEQDFNVIVAKVKMFVANMLCIKYIYLYIGPSHHLYEFVSLHGWKQTCRCKTTSAINYKFLSFLLLIQTNYFPFHWKHIIAWFNLTSGYIIFKTNQWYFLNTGNWNK